MSPKVRFPLIGVVRSLVLTGLLSVGPAGAAIAADCTGPGSDVRLYVNVEGVRGAEGLIAVTLYADDSKRFLARRGSLYVGRIPAQSPTTRVCIHLPDTGVYALAVYHDSDANRKFNRSGVGLPREGFGFSNNPAVLLGIPSFKAVRLRVDRTDLSTTVRLRYP